MKLTAKDSADFQPHEAEEWLPGKIIDIEETEGGKYGPGLKLVLVLDDDEPNEDGTDREVWAYTSQTLSPKSKLGRYVEAITGELPAPGEVFDLDELIGKKVEVFFERYTGTNKETGEPQEKEKVTKMRAAKKASRRRAEPVEDDETPEPPAVSKRQADAARAAKTASRRPRDDDDEAPF